MLVGDPMHKQNKLSRILTSISEEVKDLGMVIRKLEPGQRSDRDEWEDVCSTFGFEYYGKWLQTKQTWQEDRRALLALLKSCCIAINLFVLSESDHLSTRIRGSGWSCHVTSVCAMAFYSKTRARRGRASKAFGSRLFTLGPRANSTPCTFDGHQEFWPILRRKRSKSRAGPE